MKKSMFNAMGQDIVTFASRKIILIMMIMTVLTVNCFAQTGTSCATPSEMIVPCTLVQNGNFEYQSTPITTGGHLELACPWYGTFTNGLYFNEVITVTNVSTTYWEDHTGVNTVASSTAVIPYNLNYEGDQSSCDPTGAIDGSGGYAAFYSYKESNGSSDVENKHTYISQQLSCPMIKDLYYDVSFWVSLSDFSTHSTSHLGMYLSVTDPGGTDYEVLDGALVVTSPQGQMAHATAGSLGTTAWAIDDLVDPQIKQAGYGATFITDGHTNATGWAQISGIYHAKGGEMFITIGDFGTLAVQGDDQTLANFLEQENEENTPANLWNPSNYTVNDHACYYVDQVSITPQGGSYPAPLITSNVPPCIFTLNGDITYTITNFNDDPNVTYTATAHIEGNDYPLTVSGGGQFVINFNDLEIDHIPGCGFTITIGMTVCDCSAKFEYTIYGCCKSEDRCPVVPVTIVLGDEGSTNDMSVAGSHLYKASQLYGNTSLPGGWAGAGPNVNNKKFSINGLFVVDANLDLYEDDISMGHEAKIEILPGYKLTLEESWIHSCCDMWNSITIDDNTTGSGIDVHDCFIEDGDSAIISDKGGFYRIVNTVFNKNYIGLVVKENDQKIDNPLTDFLLEGSLFTCRDFSDLTSSFDYCSGTIGGLVHNLLTSPTDDFTPANYPYYSALYNETDGSVHSGDYPYTTLITPMTGIRSHIGVEVEKVAESGVDPVTDPFTPLIIGDPTGAGTPTDFLVDNNYMNTFDAIDFGVRTIYSNVSVYNNIFVNINKAIPCQNCVNFVTASGVWAAVNIEETTSRHLQVGDNDNEEQDNVNYFYNDNEGVFSYNYNNDIVGNHMLHGLYYGVFLDNAIDRQNRVFSNYMDDMNNGVFTYNLLNSIYDNGIWFNYVGVTPHVNSSTKSSFAIGCFNQISSATPLWIHDNEIHLNSMDQSHTAAGIRVEETAGEDVDLNHIYFETPANDNGDPAYGIWLVDDYFGYIEGNLVQMNTTTPAAEDVYYGIYTNKVKTTRVLNNDLEHMGSGIAATKNCDDTGYGCNLFNYNWFCFYFYTPELPDQYPGPAPDGQAQNNIFNATNLSGYDIDGSVTVQSGYGSGSQIYWYDPNTPVLTLTASITIICPSPSPAIDGSPCDGLGGGGGGQSPVIGGITEGMSQPQAREALLGRIVRGDNVNDTSHWQYMYEDSVYAYRTLSNTASWLSLGTNDDNTYQSFYNYCSGTNIGAFESVNSHIIGSHYTNVATANATNEGISPIGVVEENQKLFNSIYLKKAACQANTANGVAPQYNLDATQKAALQSIAYQDSRIGGDAVNQARILLWVDVNDRTIGNLRSVMHTTKPAQNITSNYKLYPNPNTGSMTLEYNMEGTSEAIFSIYAMDGRLVKQLILSANNKSVSINATELDAGIYYYNVKEEGKKAKTEKLVIVK